MMPHDSTQVYLTGSSDLDEAGVNGAEGIESPLDSVRVDVRGPIHSVIVRDKIGLHSVVLEAVR